MAQVDKSVIKFVLAIISAKYKFSSKLMRKILKCKNLKFASPEEVKKLTVRIE
jgi:prolyl-tRNA editing enzyme YbaK/EbsC (Cys-tRNA(Pro) deacylase)